MVITLAADVYLPSQKMLAQQLRQLEADGIMFTRRYHRKLNIDSRIGGRRRIFVMSCQSDAACTVRQNLPV